MNILRLLIKISLVTLLGLLTVQCGKKGSDSDKVHIEVVPKKPQVYTADWTVGDETFEKAWFLTSIKVVNNTDYPLTLIAFSFEVTAQGPAGPLVGLTADIDASEFNYTVAVTDEINCTYTFSHFDTIAAHSWAYVTISTIPEEGVSANCSAVGPDDIKERSSAIKIGVTGNPMKPEASHYRYQVKMTPQGWFGTISEPEERFEKSINFTTE